MSESPNLPVPITAIEKPNPLTPKHWQIAWDEFGRLHPYMKHGAVLVNWILFNGLGGSVLLGISLVRGWLPLTAWIITFLSTTILTQIFMAHYTGAAYERQLSELRTPHLTVVFDPDDPDYIYPQQVTIPDGTPTGVIKDCLLFKVGVISTIPDFVRLAIPSLKIDGKSATGVFLHISDDETYKKRETHLNAHADPVFWDVIATCANHDKFFLEHIKPNTGRELPANEVQEFVITASGRQGKIPTRKLVRFFLDEKKKPQFELRELEE